MASIRSPANSVKLVSYDRDIFSSHGAHQPQTEKNPTVALAHDHQQNSRGMKSRKDHLHEAERVRLSDRVHHHINTNSGNASTVPINTAHLLLGASLPLSLGAYAGYRHQMKKAALEEKGCEIAYRRAAAEAPVLAARALAIGSVLSIGGVSLLGACAFYATGCGSVDEAVSRLKLWAPAKRRQIGEWLGLDYVPPSARHPDVLATTNMSEDEELEYLREKYQAEWSKGE